MSVRCEAGLHKWSKWDLLHRWCLRCRKVQYTEFGRKLMKAILP